MAITHSWGTVRLVKFLVRTLIWIILNIIKTLIGLTIFSIRWCWRNCKWYSLKRREIFHQYINISSIFYLQIQYAHHYNPWFVQLFPLCESQKWFFKDLSSLIYDLVYGLYSRGVHNQQQVIMGRILGWPKLCCLWRSPNTMKAYINK